MVQQLEGHRTVTVPAPWLTSGRARGVLCCSGGMCQHVTDKVDSGCMCRYTGHMSNNTERTCRQCKRILPLTSFYLEIEARRAAREGRSHYHYPCRECQSARARESRRGRQDFIDSIKLAKGCADCGTRLPHPEIYDFDHKPGVIKARPVSAFLTSGSMDELVAEIAKCDVVCANCHRIRTRQRPSVTSGKTRKGTQ